MLIFVTRLNSRRSRSADIYYGQSKLRWYRCDLSCDRNELALEAARIVAGRLFQTLGAAIEKRRDALLVLEGGTDSMSRDDERRLRVGLYIVFLLRPLLLVRGTYMSIALFSTAIKAVHIFSTSLFCNMSSQFILLQQSLIPT